MLGNTSSDSSLCRGVLVIQSTSIFVGKSSLWIFDLSVPDHLAKIPAFPWISSNLNLLPLILMGSIWLFAMIMQDSEQSMGLLYDGVS